MDDMEAMVKKLKGSETYDWKIGLRPLSPRLPSFAAAPYLIGIPKPKSN